MEKTPRCSSTPHSPPPSRRTAAAPDAGPRMKFTEHLSAHITPEWRKQYIQYEVSTGSSVSRYASGSIPRNPLLTRVRIL